MQIGLPIIDDIRQVNFDHLGGGHRPKKDAVLAICKWPRLISRLRVHRRGVRILDYELQGPVEFVEKAPDLVHGSCLGEDKVFDLLQGSVVRPRADKLRLRHLGPLFEAVEARAVPDLVLGGVSGNDFRHSEQAALQ